MVWYWMSKRNNDNLVISLVMYIRKHLWRKHIFPNSFFILSKSEVGSSPKTKKKEIGGVWEGQKGNKKSSWSFILGCFVWTKLKSWRKSKVRHDQGGKSSSSSTQKSESRKEEDWTKLEGISLHVKSSWET